MKTEINHARINYALSGSGPCLVLIHGFSDNLTMWANQIPEFSKSYQVLAIDVRGHGDTEVLDGNYELATTAEDLNVLLDSLNIKKACVLGYSMGGRIALSFALTFPDKTSGIVFANSGVMGPGAELPQEQMAEMMARRMRMMELMESKDVAAISDFMAEQSFSPGFREKDPDTFEKYKQVKMRNNPAAYATIMAGMAEAMANPPDLSRLACPALIIAGTQDGFMAMDTAYYMEKAIKDATLEVFPTGHASAIEVPDLFNQAVLNFLKKIY